MKRLVVILLAAAFVTVGSLAAVAADNKGPAEITIDAPKAMGGTKVAFPHAAHQAKIADCKTCHHNGVEAGKCTGCHGVKPEAPAAKDAFHKQCQGCHKEKGAGPTKCGDCHKK